MPYNISLLIPPPQPSKSLVQRPTELNITHIPPDLFASNVLFYIDAGEILNFSLTCRWFNACVNQISVWKVRLNKEGVNHVAQKKYNGILAKIYFIQLISARLEKEIPTDKHGLHYLSTLGITNKALIQYIKQGLFTINQTCTLNDIQKTKLTQPNIQMYIARGQLGNNASEIIGNLNYFNENGEPQNPLLSIYTRLIIHELNLQNIRWLHPFVQKLFALNIVTIPYIESINTPMPSVMKILNSTTIQKYLLNGELNLKEVLESLLAQFFPDIEELDSEKTKLMLENKELTVKDLLQSDTFTRQHLEYKKVTEAKNNTRTCTPTCAIQ